MECTTSNEHMSALTDGELNDQDASSLFTHLGACRACRRFYRQLLLTRELLLRSAREALPSQPAAEEQVWLMKRGAERVSMAGRRAGGLRVARPLAIAAVVALLALGGSTTALLLERSAAASKARVVYVVGLPTIEVEASYLRNGVQGL